MGFLVILLLLLLENNTTGDCTDTPGANTTAEAYQALKISDLSYTIFSFACEGYNKLNEQKSLKRDSVLTIIDFSKPSCDERLYVIDMKNRKLLAKSLVAHGKSSGEIIPHHFSNQPSSHKSSLGFFVTGETYIGKHGYSLRIKGVEEGINNNAWTRAIVFHGASYVSEEYIEKNGRLGRSFGCPALPRESNRAIIDSIKNSSCIFIYAPDGSYIRQSRLVSSMSYSQTTAE